LLLFLSDILRGEEYTGMNLTALNRVIILTATKDKRILFRQYEISRKNSGQLVTIHKILFSEIIPYKPSTPLPSKTEGFFVGTNIEVFGLPSFF
jgi:hypothetical protein